MTTASVVAGVLKRRRQNSWLNRAYRLPDKTIEAGKVSTQARIRLRTVPRCRPEPLAAIVPATPEDRTCVVLTGKPNISAAAIVLLATISAAAPCPQGRCHVA